MADLDDQRKIDALVYDYLLMSFAFKAAKKFAENTNIDTKPKGPVFPFRKLGNIHPSNGKITCCHFSSDGKFLASGGDEKKVLMWDVENFKLTKMAEKHSRTITDVRFLPNSTLFATSSVDRTMLLWDARKSDYKWKIEGHNEEVTSLDFCESVPNLLCSCDSSDEIRMWTVAYDKPWLLATFKGANKQVRFQPQMGKLLAAASGRTINLIDIDTYQIVRKLEGHSKDIRSLCWDMYGNYLASVSEDSARVWCIQTGKCEQELSSSGNVFESCTFHPCFTKLLIVGSYQLLVLWNARNNKSLTVQAHKDIISSLSYCLHTGVAASASHDEYVKFWK